MLESIFTNSSSSVELTAILICSLVSIILGILIAITHKATSKYNKNFLVTISILPLLVETVIIMVNGNLGTSVAILGAFSLVKFRSIPGNSKEILSLFFSMAVGLATGMGQLIFASIITVIGCISLFLLNRIKIFDIDKQDRILKISIPENLDYTNIFDNVFEKYTKNVSLDQVKTTNLGSIFELSYRVTLAKDINEKKFIDDLRIKNGNLKIVLTHPLGENDL